MDKNEAIAEVLSTLNRNRDAVAALQFGPDDVVYQWFSNGLCVGVNDDGQAFACGIVGAKVLKRDERLPFMVTNGAGEKALSTFARTAQKNVLDNIDAAIRSIPSATA